jgi:Cu/Ag efflux protein CusF
MKSALAVLLVASCLGCNKLFPVDVGQGQAKGMVLRIDTVHNLVTLDHDEIPNLIEGMTFSYPVKDGRMLRQVHLLDTVIFTLRETSPGSFEVESMRKVGS